MLLRSSISCSDFVLYTTLDKSGSNEEVFEVVFLF